MHIKRHRTQPMLQASSCLNCAYQVAPEGAAAHGFGAYQVTSQTTMLQVSGSLSCAGVNQCCWQKALPLTGSVHIKLHRTQPVLQASSRLNCGVSKASNSLTEASGRDAMLPRFLLGRTPRLPRFAHACTDRGMGEGELEFRAWAAGNRVAVEVCMACQRVQAVWTA